MYRLISILMMVSLFLLSGCGVNHATQGSSENDVLSYAYMVPMPPAVPEGQTAAIEFTITNESSDAVALSNDKSASSAASVSETDDTDVTLENIEFPSNDASFTITNSDSKACFKDGEGDMLAAGASCQVIATVAMPNYAEDKNDTMQVDAVDASGNSLSALSIPINLHSVSSHDNLPAGVITGDPAVLAPGKTTTLTLLNTSEITAINNPSLVFNDDSLKGEVNSISSTCSLSLAPGATCQFSFEMDINSESYLESNQQALDDNPDTKKLMVTAANIKDDLYPALQVDTSSLGVFSFSSADLILKPGDNSETVTLTNSGETAITHYWVAIPSGFASYIDSGTNTCPAAEDENQTLSVGGSCQFSYSIPDDDVDSYSGVITANGDAATVRTTPEPLPVHIATEGYFKFDPISLNALADSGEGSVTLSNLGAVKIDNFYLSYPSGFIDYIISSDTSCPDSDDPGTLSANGSCTIDYDTTGMSGAIIGANILAIGEDAENSPKNLPIRIIDPTKAYIDFSPASLELTEGQSGDFTVTNEGGGPIEGFWLSIPIDFDKYVSVDKDKTPCPTSADAGDKLEPGKSCSLHYNTTGATQVDAFSSEVVANASNPQLVSNLSTTLPVSLVIKGTMVFSPSFLTLTPHSNTPSAGTVAVTNTGGETVTNFSLSNFPTSDMSITHNSCGTTETPTDLKPGAANACHFDYELVSSPTDLSQNIIASGDADTVRRTPTYLPVRVLTAGQLAVYNASDDDTPAITSLPLTANTSGTLLVKNIGGETIDNLDVAVYTSALSNYFSLPETGGCENGQELAPGQSCQIDYNTTGATQSLVGNIRIDASGGDITNVPLNLPVDLQAGQGTLSYYYTPYASNQKLPITGGQLSLSSGDVGTIYIQNDGDATVNDFTAYLEGLGFSNNCLNHNDFKLAPHDSCEISYNVTTTTTITGYIKAVGNPIDVSGGVPSVLNVTVTPADKGHIVFEDSSGANLSNPLSIANGAKGSFQIVNTGKGDITDFNVVIPNDLAEAGFSKGNNCGETLQPNVPCTINYEANNSNDDSSISDDITVSGDNADNSGVTETVEISAAGQGQFGVDLVINTPTDSSFQSKSPGDDTITLPLVQNQTAKIIVTNTGDGEIEDYYINLPTIAGMTVTSNSCPLYNTSQRSLAPGDSCTIAVSTALVSSSADGGNGTLTPEGNNVGNTESVNIQLTLIGQLSLITPMTSPGDDGSNQTGDLASNSDSNTLTMSDGHSVAILVTNTGYDTLSDLKVNGNSLPTGITVDKESCSSMATSLGVSSQVGSTTGNTPADNTVNNNQVCIIRLKYSASSDNSDADIAGTLTVSATADDASSVSSENKTQLVIPITALTTKSYSACDEAMAFAQVSTVTNSTVLDGCNGYIQNSSTIQANCGDNTKASASCSNILNNDKYGGYRLLAASSSNDLESSRGCSREVGIFSANYSAIYNVSPAYDSNIGSSGGYTCMNYYDNFASTDSTNINEYVHARCDKDDGGYSTTTAGCASIYSHDMMGDKYQLCDNNGTLVADHCQQGS